MKSVEWPTLALLAGCYLVFGIATTAVAEVSLGLSILLTALSITLHASLTHEIVHGHPFRNPRLNALLVAPALNLLVPFLRFRDTHLDHHHDANLTDPYDDPESNYLDPVVWARLPVWAQAVLRANNTLLGRMVLGPVIGQAAFMIGDLRRWREGDSRIVRAWLWHVPAVGLVALWLGYVAGLPFWGYAIAVYLGVAILRIRTFLEHQAHERASGRTAIVEDRGPLAFLFLNNNLHVVHHKHPNVAWYRLPRLYRDNQARFQDRNGHYVFASYREVFRRHLLTPKDPVPHPMWPAREESVFEQDSRSAVAQGVPATAPITPGAAAPVLDKTL